MKPIGYSPSRAIFAAFSDGTESELYFDSLNSQNLKFCCNQKMVLKYFCSDWVWTLPHEVHSSFDQMLFNNGKHGLGGAYRN